MVTSTLPNRQSSRFNESQKDTKLSDFEIAHRVLAIRSSWTDAERVQRHTEAQRRFDSLLEALNLEATPAN